jgi:hypothetical protein
MPRASAEAEREKIANRLIEAFPTRLAGLSARQLMAAMMDCENKGGRSVGGGRKNPNTDDRYLYVMAFQHRGGIPPEQTLLSLLGLERPTEADDTTNKDYARILSYYRNHPELYRDVGLVLRWDEKTERLSVIAATAADLKQMLPEPILDVDELFKQRP